MIEQDQLISAIGHEEAQALGFMTNELSSARAQAIDRYMGRPVGKLAVTGGGRSEYVSNDVADTINSIMPSLMKIFMSGDELLQFNPQNADDVAQAEQETDYVNHVVMQSNDAFIILYNWFHDTLLLKNGYIKYYWEEYQQRKRDLYQGLTDDEVAMLLQRDDVQPIAATKRPIQVPGPDGQMVTMEVTDLRLQYTTKRGRLVLENVPPEEVLVASRARHLNVKQSPFVQHRTRKTLSQIREMGLQVEDDVSDSDDAMQRSEVIARRSSEESMFFNQLSEGSDPSTREVTLKESYIYMDIDGDKIAELCKVIHVGNTILDWEEVDEIPLSSLSPYPQPHKHIGRSIEELIRDIADLKTTLIRQIVDNTVAGNLGRFAINTDAVTIDDFLNGRANGVVRIKGNVSNNIMPITPSPISNQAFPLIEMLDSEKENRVGVTRYNQGTDANSLNKTASGISQIMTAAQEKIELIARIFAETGVKDLFLSAHKVLQKHDKFQNVVKLRNQWVTVNPMDWQDRDDMTISVGIGTGNKLAQQQFVQQMLMMQEKALPLQIATRQNVYNALVKLTQLGGLKNYNDYWTSPPPGPMPMPPDPHAAKAQADAQGKQAELAANQQKHQVELQADAQKFQAQSAIDQQKMTIQQQHELQLKAIDTEAQKEIELIRKQAQVELEQIKAASATPPVEDKTDDNGIAQAVQMMAQALQILSAPKTKMATLPDGRKIQIDEAVTS